MGLNYLEKLGERDLVLNDFESTVNERNLHLNDLENPNEQNLDLNNL